MEQGLPIHLSLALEALARNNLEEAKGHFKDLYESSPQNFESYAPEALGYFVHFTPTAIDPVTRETNLKAIEEICRQWQLEDKKPGLALKAYCFTGNRLGVGRVIDKVLPQQLEANTAFTGEPPLADSVVGNNDEIVSLLLKKGAWKGPSALRMALGKAARLGNEKCLAALIHQAPKAELDAHMLRDALIQTIIYRHTGCYRKLCNFAPTQALETWINQVKAMQKEHTADPHLPSYENELKIINTEISKRLTLEKVSSSATIEI
jgi:hypothetical protein